MSTYIIETRTAETEDAPSGPWHSDGLSSRPEEIDGIRCGSPEEAEEIVANLRRCGPDWNADYRYREATP
jgi:hypothetical protein